MAKDKNTTDKGPFRGRIFSTRDGIDLWRTDTTWASIALTKEELPVLIELLTELGKRLDTMG
jgi:hypothetical protein